MTLTISEYRPEFSPTASSPTKPQQTEMGASHPPNLNTNNHSQSNYQLGSHHIPSTPMVNTGLAGQYNNNNNIDYHSSSFHPYKVRITQGFFFL